MDAKAKAVSEILHSGHQFLVPFFQRSYSWQKKQWKRLWNDLKTLLDDTERKHHFLGPLVCSSLKSQPGEIQTFQLIDGQQRLTTLSLLLAAVRDACARCGNEETAAEISETYLVNRFKKGMQRYKVIPRVGDREMYFDLVDGKKFDDDDATTLDEAHRFFAKAIQTDGFGQEAQQLQRLFETIISRLHLVVITLDGENPYEIFESLNSTGLPLQESDLVRNFLFMQLQVEEHAEFQRQHWSKFEELFDPEGTFKALPATKFYREFLMRGGRYSRAGATFVDYKSYFQERQLTSVSALTELTHYVKLALALTRRGQGLPPALAKAVARFELLEAATAHPLLLNLLDRHSGGALSEVELLGILSDLTSFIVRRSFCGETTRPYGRWFCEAIQSLGEHPRAGLQSYLAHRGWPDDESFIKSVEEFPAYRRELKKTRLILESIEQSYGHKEKVDLSTLQIEHVLPQKLPRGPKGESWRQALGEQWHRTHRRLLHTLGNLTLTGYNLNLSNKPFAEKREALIESKLSSNAFFKKTSEWNAAVIRARSRELAEKVVSLWPRPEGIPPYKAAVSPRAGVPRAGRERRRAYWTKLIELLREQKSPWLPLEAPDGAVLDLNLPLTDANLSVRFQLSQKRFQIALRFARRRGKQIFEALQKDRDAVDGRFEQTPTWGSKSDPCISVVMDNATIKDPLDWYDQHVWIAQRLTEFYEALFDRLGQLDKQIVETSPTKTQHLEYWTAFRKVMESSSSIVKPTKPLPQYWQNFAIGRSGICLSAIANTQAKHVAVQLLLSSSVAKAQFHLLRQDKAKFEAAVGQKLQWQELPNKKQSRIALSLEGDPTDHSDWPRQHAWLFDHLQKFHAAFSQAVKQLNTDDYEFEPT